MTTILTHDKSWRAAPLGEAALDLTDDEAADVRRAIAFLWVSSADTASPRARSEWQVIITNGGARRG